MAHTDNPRLILGLKLRALRHARRETLQSVAERAAISLSYLSEIEKGRKYPKPEKLLRIAEALDVPFDDLVSLRVADELDPIKEALDSQLLREFPFALFGLAPQDLIGLVSGDPSRSAALVRALLEIGRTYDMNVEHFLLSALRAYQQMNANYFADLERAAADFRLAQGWSAGDPVDPAALSAILETDYDYEIDDQKLAPDPELAGFRSVFSPGTPPTLYLNRQLLPSQRAFALAREIGYRHLDLGQRALSSSWLEVESFDQLLNNFKASYFSGALLIDGERLRDNLEVFFKRPRWSDDALLELMHRYATTPETFFTRWTQLIPKHFGLDEIYFMRFSKPARSESIRLTKWLNMSRVAVPHGIGLHEHYCRRWAATRLLQQATTHRPSQEKPLVVAQREVFLKDGATFFVVAMARPLALSKDTNSCVSIGFLVNEEFKQSVAFADDPDVPRVEVDLTCERCPLAPADCSERAVPPRLAEDAKRQARREAALARLLDA